MESSQSRESRPRRRWVIPVAIAAAVLLLVLFVWVFSARAETVETVTPVRQEVVELVIASGSLQAERRSDVGTTVAGIVESVLVREGARVAAGQVLLTIDRRDAEQRVEQARRSVETAERQLEQVRRVNAAQLVQARERLAQVQAGRPEEIRRAQAAVQQARANLEQAETDLSRTQRLVERGALPRADLDQARTRVSVARAEVRAAEESLAIARQPASREQINVARAEVRAAEAALQESVRVAQAQINEARSALRSAEIDLGNRIIESPISGLVVNRNVEPGQSASPGQALITVADMTTSRVVVETDETNLPRLAAGQPAILIPPAFPDRSFRGVVSRIGPQVQEERGIVNVEIRPLTVPDYARPDMTVDANIEVARIEQALTVPVSALITEGGDTFVLVAEGDRAVAREVRVLARGERFAAVEGIPADADVIVRGTGVAAGDRIRVAGG